MKFYIVTPPIQLLEEERGFVGKWFPGFFNLLNASTELPMKNREITPELLKGHLQSSYCWDRHRFDSMEEAIAFVSQEDRSKNEAVPIYSCSIPTEPYGVLIAGKPSRLPSNATFLSLDEFTVDTVSLYNKNGHFLDVGFPSTTTHEYRR